MCLTATRKRWHRPEFHTPKTGSPQSCADALHENIINRICEKGSDAPTPWMRENKVESDTRSSARRFIRSIHEEHRALQESMLLSRVKASTGMSIGLNANRRGRFPNRYALSAREGMSMGHSPQFELEFTAVAAMTTNDTLFLIPSVTSLLEHCVLFLNIPVVFHSFVFRSLSSLGWLFPLTDHDFEREEGAGWGGGWKLL